MMSPNEMNKARQLGQRYEVQYWGGVDLAVDPKRQYDTLVAAGYPIVIVDPVVVFDVEGWTIEPDGWRISKP